MSEHNFWIRIAGYVGFVIGLVIVFAGVAMIDRFAAWRRKRARTRRGIHTWDIDDVYDDLINR